MARTAAAPTNLCPECNGTAALDLDNGAIARYTCTRCEHCWEEDRPTPIDPAIDEALEKAKRDGFIPFFPRPLSAERDRKVGPSPYPCPRCKSVIARNRLVWMVGAGCVVPAGWDVHHRDENRSADNFDNLICLHKLDHKKIHYGSAFACEIPE